MPDRAMVDETKYEQCIRTAYEESSAGAQWYGNICLSYRTEEDDRRDAERRKPPPRALVALSEDRLSLVFLVPSKGDEAQWWSICHWDYETDRMEPMYRIVDKGQDASAVLAWYEGELTQTKGIMRDALRQVLEGRDG